MTLQLHRPDGQGGLAPTRPGRGPREDWRRALRSPRWRPAKLANSDVRPTSTPMAVAFWLVLAALTFGLLVVGYGTHFWH